MHKYLKTRWKTQDCFSKGCWCKVVVPEVEENEDECIIPPAAISAEIAEHIVKLHNDSIKAQIDADNKFRISLNNSKTIK